MNPTDFSVLLLAWDDADPGVAVLGGSALPPTLPLVYQLAAQHPVLAVYPHLPTAEATAALESSVPASTASATTEPVATPTDSDAAPGPLDSASNAPGVHLLAPAASASRGSQTPAAGGSRLVGLEDMLPAIQRALPTSHSLSLAPKGALGAGGPLAAQPLTPTRTQWPTRTGPPRPAAWQAPAAPYAGATPVPAPAQTPAYVSKREFFPPPPPAPPRPATTNQVPSATQDVSEETAATPEIEVASASVSAIALITDTAVPALFAETVEEIGAAEASDLNAPEDDLVPDSAPPAKASTAAAAEPEAAAPAVPGWAVRQPTLDGLNFRMIQYARRAAQLVDGRNDFAVIYAPGWPAWLAALEIRNRTGRPLVLYVPALASATAPAAERGWLLGVERMALRRATLVLVPDAEVLRQLQARHEGLGEVRIVPAANETAVQLVLAEIALG